jgi:phospholipid transport system substrate-binding protein
MSPRVPNRLSRIFADIFGRIFAGVFAPGGFAPALLSRSRVACLCFAGYALAVGGSRAEAADVTPTEPSPEAKATAKTTTEAESKPAGKPAVHGAKGAGKAATKAAGVAGVAGVDRSASAVAMDGKDVPPTPPPPGSSPMADLKKSNDSLDRLLKKKYPAWSPEAEAQKADVRQLVGGFLDYRELARRSLAKHWDTLTATQRKEFVASLRDLVERSYLRQVTGDPNYTMKYQKETTEGTNATVEATLTTLTRGKKVTIALVYNLVHKERWLVYDIVTDEQSMLENYRAEFNKIINKEGFDALLKRMKKKLDEKDE